MKPIIIAGPDSICVDGLILAVKEAEVLIVELGRAAKEFEDINLSPFKRSDALHDFAYHIEEEKPKVLPPWKGNHHWKKR